MKYKCNDILLKTKYNLFLLTILYIHYSPLLTVFFSFIGLQLIMSTCYLLNYIDGKSFKIL